MTSGGWAAPMSRLPNRISGTGSTRRPGIHVREEVSISGIEKLGLLPILGGVDVGIGEQRVGAQRGDPRAEKVATIQHETSVGDVQQPGLVIARGQVLRSGPGHIVRNE